jgi:hypothetical protein
MDERWRMAALRSNGSEEGGSLIMEAIG